VLNPHSDPMSGRLVKFDVIMLGSCYLAKIIMFGLNAVFNVISTQLDVVVTLYACVVAVCNREVRKHNNDSFSEVSNQHYF